MAVRWHFAKFWSIFPNDGLDPREKEKAEAAVKGARTEHTFAKIAAELQEKRKKEEISKTTLQKWDWFIRLINKDLGDMPITEIKSVDIPCPSAVATAGACGPSKCWMTRSCRSFRLSLRGTKYFTFRSVNMTSTSASVCAVMHTFRKYFSQTLISFVLCPSPDDRGASRDHRVMVP